MTAKIILSSALNIMALQLAFFNQANLPSLSLAASLQVSDPTRVGRP
jgi:hypothetical protein